MNNAAAKAAHHKFMSDSQKLKEARNIYRKRMKKKYDSEHYDEFTILQGRKRARINAGLNI